MSRFVLFSIFLLTLVAGCAPSSHGLSPVDGAEYRWGDDPSVPYRPFPDLLRMPPSRNGATVLHVRFVLPKLEGDDPAIYFGADTFDHAVVGDRLVACEPRARMVVPLDPSDGGKPVDLVLRYDGGIAVG
ncbi:MAG: hypothetical protein ACREJX_18135, partial [Polyangiaceae bacterium]